jgi:superoxide reductase
MTERLQIYKCEICGNIVELLHEGKGILVCCGQPMKLLEGKTEEQGKEKHLPVVEKTEKGVKVKVGSVPHPMEEKHYIEWVEVVTSNGMLRKFLKPADAPEFALQIPSILGKNQRFFPSDKPESEFEIKEEIVQVREYCSIHGLWTAKQ